MEFSYYYYIYIWIWFQNSNWKLQRNCCTSLHCQCFWKVVYTIFYELVRHRISANQQGFFKGRSVVTNLLDISSQVVQKLESGLGFQIATVYTDFSKALDILDQRIMIHKLYVCLVYIHHFVISRGPPTAFIIGAM